MGNGPCWSDCGQRGADFAAAGRGFSAQQPKAPVHFPLSGGAAIQATNTELASLNRDTILAQASQFDTLNNQGACPLS